MAVLFPACQNSPVHAGLADSSGKAGPNLSPGEPKHESSKPSFAETNDEKKKKKKGKKEKKREKSDLKVRFLPTPGQERARHTLDTLVQHRGGGVQFVWFWGLFALFFFFFCRVKEEQKKSTFQSRFHPAVRVKSQNKRRTPLRRN